ncbi:MAG: carbohydrate kinase, partial [Gemmatimonas sp. SG8_38_2]
MPVTTKDHLLAIDYGTQSVRALLFDPHGTLVAKNRVEVEPYFSDRPGWAEQDPVAMWLWLCEACQGLWDQSPVGKEAVAGVSLTTLRATMVNVDADGEPLRP